MKTLLLICVIFVSNSLLAQELELKQLEPNSLPQEYINRYVDTNSYAGPFGAPAGFPPGFTQRKNNIVYKLVNHEVLTNTYVLKTNGKAEYLGSKLAANGQRILFQQDYRNYMYDTIDNEKKKVGILLRLEIELISKKTDLNVNGIFAIGVAASSGTATGKIRLKIYGLTGRPISEAVPAQSDISEQSLLQAFTSIATIKSKIYDDDVYVVPQDIPELPFELGKDNL